MRLLAIDTALGACSVAIFDSLADDVVAGAMLKTERGHAERLMPLVVRVMDQAGMDFSDLDRIAVTVGPGSFTGLRVGIAAARGIALAAARRVVGVSTLAAYAAPSIAEDKAETVLAAIDARHGNLYAQAFGAGGRTLLAPTHCDIATAVAAVAGRPVHLAGAAAPTLLEHWPAGVPRPALLRAEVAPDIAWVARLGAAANPDLAPAKPLYLRPVDARPQDRARLLQP